MVPPAELHHAWRWISALVEQKAFILGEPDSLHNIYAIQEPVKFLVDKPLFRVIAFADTFRIGWSKGANMRKVMFLVFLSISISGFAQDNIRTKPTDGRKWNEWSPMAKTFFVSGFIEGTMAMRLVSGDSKTYEIFYIPKLNVGEIVNCLDAFYKDSSNSAVVVFSAWVWVGLKTKGATEAELDKEAATLRKIAAQTPPLE